MKTTDFGEWTRVLYYFEPHMKWFVGHVSPSWGDKDDGFNVRGYIHYTNGRIVGQTGRTGFVVKEAVGISYVNPRAIQTISWNSDED